MDNCEYCGSKFQADSRGNCNGCGAPHKERRPNLALGGRPAGAPYDINNWPVASTSVTMSELSMLALADAIARGMNNA